MAEIEETEGQKSVNIGRKTVLDLFSTLSDELEKKRLDSALKLTHHLLSKVRENPEESVPNECHYACRRLVRGLGSSRDATRKGYYVALVAFLSQLSDFTVEDFLASVNKELEMGKFGSKGEEGEVCFGRVMAFGAFIRSGRFTTASPEEQTVVLSGMVEAAAHKSYLPSLLATFLCELLTPGSDKTFSSVLWPALKPWLAKPWQEQTLDSLYFILQVSKTFSKAVKKTELKNLMGAPRIISDQNLESIYNILITSQNSTHRHPIYELICQELGAHPTLALDFWQSHIDAQLLLVHKNSRGKGSLAIELFRLLCAHLSNKDVIPQLLTVRFISLLRQRLVRQPVKDEHTEELRQEANTALTSLVDCLKSTDMADSARADCLERIVTSARGEFGFDQITKSNVIHSIVTSLKSDGLGRIAELCRAVITGESHPSKDDEESNDSLPTTWLNKDRMAALHLLAGLATHPAADLEFRTHHTLLFLEYAFFPPPGCTSLCPAAKESLLRCVAAPSSRQAAQPLANMREQLSDVVDFINEKISNGQKPYKASKEVLDAWKKMIGVTDKLRSILKSSSGKKKDSSRKQLASVLLVLFMQLGVQLFLDAELANDSLEELHVCVEKAGLVKEKKSTAQAEEDEPQWVEVVTDIFLSLLSQSSALLRSIVGKVFSALCPLMTEAALLSLVKALDCTADGNPLVPRSEQHDSEMSEESGSEEEEEEGSESGGEEEEEAEEEMEEETVSDRVRAAVRLALGDAGEVTDTESVDLDDIDEAEGQRLDDALSNAFSALRKTGGQKGTLTKKQSRDNKELVHFRARVLDLVEIYLQSEQSMLLTFGLIPPLFLALEACLKDVHQKPLEMRLRTCLRKLSAVKRFASSEGVDGEVLMALLRTLMAKGERTAAVFLEISQEVCAVASFLVRCSQLLPDCSAEASDGVTGEYVTAIQNFFHKRDCLIPPNFFSSVLKTTWVGNLKLWRHLVAAAFKEGSVRPFRKTQALTLLRDLAANDHLLSQHPGERDELFSQITRHAVQILSAPGSEQSALKNRYLRELMLLLGSVAQHGKGGPACRELCTAFRGYLQSGHVGVAGKDMKKAARRVQSLLDISDVTVHKPPDFEFVKPKPVANGVKPATHAIKKSKKRKVEEQANKKQQYKEEKVFKKQAKELRLNAMSDGLDTSMSFSSLRPDDLE